MAYLTTLKAFSQSWPIIQIVVCLTLPLSLLSFGNCCSLFNFFSFTRCGRVRDKKLVYSRTFLSSSTNIQIIPWLSSWNSFWLNFIHFLDGFGQINYIWWKGNKLYLILSLNLTLDLQYIKLSNNSLSTKFVRAHSQWNSSGYSTMILAPYLQFSY